MNSKNEYKNKMRSFLAKYIQDNDYADDDHLFEKGYVNSLLAIELVLFVESEFSIKVENQDLDLDNFKSVNAIVRLIDRKVENKQKSARITEEKHEP